MVDRIAPPHPAWTAVDDYIAGQLLGEDPALAGALAANAAAGLPEIDVSPPHGRLLELLARMMGARRILEIGTLGGYSTICLARALPEDGRLVTLELDPHHAAVARENLRKAGVAGKVELIVGPALDTARAACSTPAAATTASTAPAPCSKRSPPSRGSGRPRCRRWG
jgi:predicted O-methyltransferase YrrM